MFCRRNERTPCKMIDAVVALMVVVNGLMAAFCAEDVEGLKDGGATGTWPVLRSYERN